MLNCQEVVKAHMYGDLNKVVYSEPPTIKVNEKLWWPTDKTTNVQMSFTVNQQKKTCYVSRRINRNKETRDPTVWRNLSRPQSHSHYSQTLHCSNVVTMHIVSSRLNIDYKSRLIIRKTMKYVSSNFDFSVYQFYTFILFLPQHTLISSFSLSEVGCRCTCPSIPVINIESRLNINIWIEVCFVLFNSLYIGFGRFLPQQQVSAWNYDAVIMFERNLVCVASSLVKRRRSLADVSQSEP